MDPRSDTNRMHDKTLGAKGLGGAAADKNLGVLSVAP